MSKLEKRIILFAILFVSVYVGAIAMTIKSRIEEKKTVARFESAVPVAEEEARLMLAELLAPMAVLFTLAVCFIIVKRKRAKTYQRLDDADSQPQPRINESH
jgi:hypothetical protein